MSLDTFCGYVAIVGRPNVGKSTILNQIIGQKIAITSRRSQTTRHQILGIRTEGKIQTVFIDTPGIHKKQPKMINRYMNKTAQNSLSFADAILFVIDKDVLLPADKFVLQKLTESKRPVILAINKIDKLKDKSRLATSLHGFSNDKAFTSVIPISAKNNTNIAQLITTINSYMPACEHFFPEDQVTDRSERFITQELIREQIFRQLGDEIPYDTAIVIEKFSYYNNKKIPLLTIHALIYVNRSGQKAILIGRQGDRLKKIGTATRIALEKQFDIKVMLQLWVKIKSGWSDNEEALKSFGYGLTE